MSKGSGGQHSRSSRPLAEQIGICWKFLYTRSGGCFPRSRCDNLNRLVSLGIRGKELRFRFGKHCCGCSSTRARYLLLVTLHGWFHSGLLYYTGLFKALENVCKLVDSPDFVLLCVTPVSAVHTQPFSVASLLLQWVFFPFSTQTSSCKHTTGGYSLPQIAMVFFYPGKTLAWKALGKRSVSARHVTSHSEVS